MNAHTGSETQSSEGAGEGLPQQFTIMQSKYWRDKLAEKWVECVPAPVCLHYRRPLEHKMRAAQMTRNFAAVTLRQQWTTVGLRHYRGDIPPTLSLQVFSACASVLALMEEDSRADLSDILWGSVNMEVGGGGGEHKGRKREREEEKETAAVDAAKIAVLLGTLFVVRCFCSPHHPPTPPPPPTFLPSTKEYESWHSVLVWGSQADDKTQCTPPLLSPVWGWVGVPRGIR